MKFPTPLSIISGRAMFLLIKYGSLNALIILLRELFFGNKQLVKLN